MTDTLAQYSLRQIAAYLHALPNSEILLAIALTLFGYLVMTGYDTLAFHHVRHPFPYKKIALASFIGYAFNNSLGMSGLVGGSLRYRLYNAWRLTTGEIARVIAFCTISFWLGFVLLGGFIFLFDPPAAPALLHIPFGSMRILGAALLVPAIAYLIGIAIRREPVKVRDWEFKLPSPRIFVAQAAISMLDWTVAAGVLYILLPDALPMTFPQFLGVFLLAQIAGVVSNVPGGVGVFEAVILIFLSPRFPASAILGSLVAFRAIYYLFPLVVATLLLAMHETLERRQGVARVARIFGRWAPGIAPHALALMTFLTGAVLLLSGATPAIPSRLKWLHHVVPLHVIEISHFLGSIAGACLLVLARGLQQRLLRAWEMTVAVLTAGIFLQLLKGGDFEEAAILALMLFALVSTRHRFYRRSSIAGESLGLRWIGAVAIVLASFTWLGFFSYKHVGYSNDLWWQFEFRADAPRFLRAAVGVMAVLLIAATRRLLRPGAGDAQKPTPEQIAQAEAIVRIDPSSEANLALVGDKAFLFSDSGRAFIMYGVEGRSWIARGDPVGSDVEKGELIRKFRELSDLHGGWPAFYEVQRKNLHLYVDHGLSLLKIGEEARVPLEDFSLDGGSRKWMRKVQRRLEADGCTFEIIPPDEVAASLDDLRDLGVVAPGQAHAREALLARFLRRDVHQPLPGGTGPQERPSRRVRKSLDERKSRGAVCRPDAPLERRTRRRDGLHLPQPDALGIRAGIPLVQPRHGPVVGTRGSVAEPHLDPARRLCVSRRRELLQLPGTAELQGQVRSGVGADVPGHAGRARRAARSHEPGRAHRGRNPRRDHEMTREAP